MRLDVNLPDYHHQAEITYEVEELLKVASRPMRRALEKTDDGILGDDVPATVRMILGQLDTLHQRLIAKRLERIEATRK